MGYDSRDAPIRADMVLTEAELASLQAEARLQGRCGNLGTATGFPCRVHPRYGHVQCPRHELRIDSKQKAERVLAFARMPAIEAIIEIIEQHRRETCEHCGFPRKGDAETQRLILSTAAKVLDRTGLGPRATIDVVRTEGSGLNVSNCTASELVELDVLLRDMKDFQARVRARLAGETVVDNVVEGEVQFPIRALTESPSGGDGGRNF